MRTQLSLRAAGAEQLGCASGADPVALLLVARQRLLCCRHRLLRLARGLEDLAQVEPRSSQELEEVGRRGDRDGLSGERLGRVEIAPRRENLRPQRSPGCLVEGVVAGSELLADFAAALRLVEFAQPVQRFAEVGRGRREEAPVAHLLEQLAALPQRALTPFPVPCPRADVPDAAGRDRVLLDQAELAVAVSPLVERLVCGVELAEPRTQVRD